MQDILRNDNIIIKLTDFVEPLIRFIDGIVGEHVAMRVSICTHLLLAIVTLPCQCPLHCVDKNLIKLVLFVQIDLETSNGNTIGLFTHNNLSL
jgi:hypothetical protein